MDYEQNQSEHLAVEIQKLKTRNIYVDLVRDYIHRPVCEPLFSTQYGIQEEEWPQMYLLPFHCTNEVKLRVFQFKILHNILYTNERQNVARFVRPLLKHRYICFMNVRLLKI